MSCCRMRWEFCSREIDKAVLHVSDPLFDGSGDNPLPKALRDLQRQLMNDDTPAALGGVPDDLSGQQKELIDALGSILGIRTVSVRPYMIGLARAMVFEWAELQPHVEQIVAGWVGAGEVKHLEPLVCWRDHD